MPSLLLIKLLLQVSNIFMKNLHLTLYVLKVLFSFTYLLFFVLWICNRLLLSFFWTFLQHLWTNVYHYWWKRWAFSLAFLRRFYHWNVLLRILRTFCVWPCKIFLFLILFLFSLLFSLWILYEFLWAIGWPFEGDRFLSFFYPINQVEQNLVFFFELFPFLFLFFDFADYQIQFFILFLFRNGIMSENWIIGWKKASFHVWTVFSRSCVCTFGQIDWILYSLHSCWIGFLI